MQHVRQATRELTGSVQLVADSGADCRGHDYLHDSRTDSGSGVLRIDEGTGTAARHVATTMNLGLRVKLQIAIGGCRRRVSLGMLAA